MTHFGDENDKQEMFGSNPKGQIRCCIGESIIVEDRRVSQILS